MQIEWHIKLDTCLLKDIPLLVVKEGEFLPISANLNVIHKRALKAIFCDTTSQFIGGSLGIVHWQGSKEAKSVRIVLDLLVRLVINEACGLKRLSRVGNVLYP
jgi:hypothetical protein